MIVSRLVLGLTVMGMLLVQSACTTPKPRPQTASLESIASISACALIDDPEKYDHQLVQLSGTIDHGFEGFVISDRRCSSDAIWLEYGGAHGSGTVFAGFPDSEPQRAADLMVDGVSTTLEQDHTFRSFDAHIRTRGSVEFTATVIGRFFAGNTTRQPGTRIPPGYGHLGGFTLLVIQRVVAVNP
jgi:hypothetical protein